MSDEKKKIIFLEDSLDGGINENYNSNKEQFEENKETRSIIKEDNEIDNEIDNQEVLEHIGNDLENFNGSDSEDSLHSDLISEGGRGSISSGSSVSTVNTSDLLSVDPMYIRLTKFLETDIKLEGGGNKKVNVTELLYDVSNSLKQINVTFKEMSDVLKKMAVNNSN